MEKKPSINLKPRSLGMSYLVSHVVTPELLQSVVSNSQLWEGKYDSEVRTASFIYIGNGREDSYIGFRMSDIAIDESVFRDSLWKISGK